MAASPAAGSRFRQEDTIPSVSSEAQPHPLADCPSVPPSLPHFFKTRNQDKRDRGLSQPCPAVQRETSDLPRPQCSDLPWSSKLGPALSLLARAPTTCRSRVVSWTWSQAWVSPQWGQPEVLTQALHCTLPPSPPQPRAQAHRNRQMGQGTGACSGCCALYEDPGSPSLRARAPAEGGHQPALGSPI